MNQKGFVNLLILIAAVGLIAFLVITSIVSFSDTLFKLLYPKPDSFASGPIGSTGFIPGDINRNGRVDVFDFNLLITDFGKTDSISLRSDVNHNGRVDIFDFNLLITNFGQEMVIPTVVPSSTPGVAMQIWGVVDPVILGNCSVAIHDQYVIDGGDGFYYRTWHPQVDSSGCVFAHEHGDDPDTMQDSWVRENWDGRFGYVARRMTSEAEPNGHAEAHEGYKVFSANVGLVNDEGRINRTASLSTFHMGTGTPKRFTIEHHSNSIAYRYQSGTPYAATSLMMDTGGVSDVCDPRAEAPTKDAITLQNRCKINSGYEIWSTFQTIKDNGREIYRVFVTPAVFDPITVFNRDNPLEVVYAWDPRVAAVKNFNDDWSGNRGCVRENYAQVGYFYNSDGPTTYYTNPMGEVVSEDTPGAIRQIVSASNIVGLASTQDNLQFKKKTDYCTNINALGWKN